MKTKFSRLVDRKSRRGNLNLSKGTENRKIPMIFLATRELPSI